jgi:hypothetical protein
VTANIPGLEPHVDDVGWVPGEVEERGRRRRTSRGRLYLRRFLRNRGAVVGLAILALLILFALVGSLFTGYTYTDVDFANLSSAPSPEHLFGTNGAGNDTYAQAVHGLQRSLVIALVVSLLTTVIAAFVGAVAALWVPETRPMPADMLLLGRRKPGMIPPVALRVIYQDPAGAQPGNGPRRCRPPLPGSPSATATPSSPPPSTPNPEPSPCRHGCGRWRCGGPVGGLEQFDQIAVGVGEQDLAPTRASDQVTAEGQARVAEPGDLGVQVVDDELDAVTARSGGIVGGGAGAGAGGSGQQQPQRATDHVGEGGCGAGVQSEAEVGGVEADGGLHVADEVADAGVLVRCGHR